MTTDPNGGGAGAAFAVGSLANALTGSLTTVFDVNFMEDEYYQDGSQPFEENLIGFVSQQAPPNPTSHSGASLACIAWRRDVCALGALRRKRARR